MAMTQAQIDAELARKKALGIKPTDPNNMKRYSEIPAPKMPIATNSGNTMVADDGINAPFAKPVQNVPAPQNDKGAYFGRVFGGVDQYAGGQQKRYDQAYASGDTDLIGRLEADSKRVGYSLNVPKPLGPPKPNNGLGNVPAPQFNPVPIPTDADRAAEARRRVQMAIEERRRQTEQQKTGIQTSYNRVREDIGDDRVLEDVANERRLDPFSGRSDYALGMIARERGRSDREMQQDLLTRQANADQGLADFEKLSFEEQQRLIDQFKREDRDYGLRANDQQFNQYDRNRNFNRDVYEDDRNFNRGTYESDRGYNRGVTESDRTFKYQQTRDAIQDKRYQQEFDENQRRYGLEYATKKAMEDKQLSLSWYNAQTSRQNSNNSASSNETNRLMDIWKATGVAPKGIEGVAEGTPWQSGSSSKNSYQSSPDFAEDVAWINQNSSNSLSEIQASSQDLIAKYGYEGYLELLNLAKSLSKLEE
jgi:hypothetical protein